MLDDEQGWGLSKILYSVQNIKNLELTFTSPFEIQKYFVFVFEGKVLMLVQVLKVVDKYLILNMVITCSSAIHH